MQSSAGIAGDFIASTDDITASRAEADSYWFSQPRTSTNRASDWKSMFRFDLSQRQANLHSAYCICRHCIYASMIQVVSGKFLTWKASFLNSLRIPKSGNGQVTHFLEFTQQLAHQEFLTSHIQIFKVILTRRSILGSVCVCLEC